MPIPEDLKESAGPAPRTREAATADRTRVPAVKQAVRNMVAGNMKPEK